MSTYLGVDLIGLVVEVYDYATGQFKQMDVDKAASGSLVITKESARVATGQAETAAEEKRLRDAKTKEWLQTYGGGLLAAGGAVVLALIVSKKRKKR
jgi:hypothetical protein